ncbi:MAG: hypothetical protein MUE44_12265 [Oscillatoriaceae cyanobacterium Prado104]|jgi:hypothetical protein|nr:hypothetical protein [Oscillatoriaceae cyanobacterium Prado104]
MQENLEVKYHQQSLEMLGLNGVLKKQPVPELIEWAKTNNIVLPAAYIEWAQLGGEELLERYSNDDRFHFGESEIVTTPEGVKGLWFHQENQGNFTMIVALDRGDDPPVLYSDIGQPPWIVYTEKFSDFVFAQIFDWQYKLEFDTESDEKWIVYTGNIDLKTSKRVSILRDLFEELVTTNFIIDDEPFTVYRFWKSLQERISVIIIPDGTASIEISGEYNLVLALEADLLETFTEEVVPRAFDSVGRAVDFLSSVLDNGLTSKLRHAFIEKPSQAAIDLLLECHRSIPLRERALNQSFPKSGSEFELGGAQWGLVLCFRRDDPTWWWSIEKIDKSSL